MEQKFVALFTEFGVLVVVANVLLDQLGLPIPAIPTLVLAGAIATTGSITTLELFFGAIAACVIADSVWYLAGRRYGSRVMKLLCRISISPDSCVSDTQMRFERWGAGALIMAKFVPGLGIIAPPLAGATRMHWRRFLSYSALGSVLWVGAGLGAGLLLRPQIVQLLPHLRQVGTTAVALFAAMLVLYVAFKWIQRYRFFAALRSARISVTELYELIASGAAPLIVDVRSATAHQLDPRIIPGALRITLADVRRHLHGLPRERDIVLYCTCPNEASAAQVAQVLIQHGFTRVRPLQGGLDAWLAAGYEADARAPVEPIAVVSVADARTG
jgi:membrane protein DedA with SNARE-associated domain/rhodanese-related sulfurtransferase